MENLPDRDVETAPFGGWKQSGSGLEGGKQAIMEFLRTKNVYIPMN